MVQWGQKMMGWRTWVLVLAALAIGLWATFALVLEEDEAASSLAAELLAESEGQAHAHTEQIRQESRNALREVLRDAEEKDGPSR